MVPLAHLRRRLRRESPGRAKSPHFQYDISLFYKEFRRPVPPITRTINAVGHRCRLTTIHPRPGPPLAFFLVIFSGPPGVGEVPAAFADQPGRSPFRLVSRGSSRLPKEGGVMKNERIAVSRL